MVAMTVHDFKQMIDRAIEAVPDEFRRKIRNVAFVVETRPRAGKGRRRKRCELLGLYEGVPLTERGMDPDGPFMPDTITLFKGAIEREAGDEKEIPAVIRETVWHEIAHYFGFDEDGALRLERKWEERFQRLNL